MKLKISVITLFLLTLVFSQSCSYRVKVPAGNVGIKVNMYGSDKGVNYQEYGPGKYWLSTINEEMFIFPTFKQNYVWTQDKNESSIKDESITFQTKEGMQCNADVGITYSLQQNKISEIFQKYRKGIEEITGIYCRNAVRDALVSVASTMPVESVYGNGKTKLINEAEKIVKDHLGKEGINVEKLYWVGSIRLPSQVIAALNRKIEATQRAEQRENELREATAEAQKQIAKAKGDSESILIQAKAKAKANEVINRSLTKNLIQYEAIKKWDGVLPKVSGKNTPFITIDMDKK